MHILKDKTQSLCPECYNEVPAQVIEKNDRVYISKECPEHGKFEVMIEKDAKIYKRLMNKKDPEECNKFDSLTISVTHDCDMSCSVCYLPKRDGKKLSLEEIKNTIARFSNGSVRLTGGEPNCRGDIPEIVKYISKLKRNSILITNGLRLSDKEVVRQVRNAGLTRVHFPFYGFDDNIYKKINGRALLKKKLKALRYLKKFRQETTLSMLAVSGINSDQIRRVFKYCVRNNSFIKQLRLRSVSDIGKGKVDGCIFLSDLIKSMAGILGVSTDYLIGHSIRLNPNHAPCHIEIDMLQLFMEEMRQKRIDSMHKKLGYLFLRILPLVGAANVIRMLVRKLRGKGRIFDFEIKLRSWPDRHNVDLSEIRRCPTGYATFSGDKLLPFCYALIINDKFDVI